MGGVKGMARAVLLAWGLGAAGAEPGRAQAELLGPGAAFLAAGVSRVATADLEDRLAEGGYPTFGRTALALGLGGYRVLSSGLVLGAEWHGLVLGEEAHGGGEVGVGGGYGTLGVGYAFPLSDRARVYPRLGLGAGGMGLWIESEGDEPGFDEVLEDPRPAPGRQPVLSRAGPVLDLGGGAELLPGDGSGLLVGLRLGWLVAPFEGEWWLYEREVAGGPDASIGGPYARVVVGLAWTR